MEIHTVLVAAHATAATVALGSAVLALRAPRFLALHTVSTVAMSAILVPSLWVSRASNPLPLQLVFLGLLGLSAVMAVRSVRAWLYRPAPGEPGGPDYLSAVGFNLIGLVTGLVTVAVMDSRLGVLGVVLAAVSIPAAGHLLLQRAKRSAVGA
jgi:hypothetical protein